MPYSTMKRIYMLKQQLGKQTRPDLSRTKSRSYFRNAFQLSFSFTLVYEMLSAIH